MRSSSSLRIVVSVALAILLVAQPAYAVTGYEQVIDLTFPTAIGGRYSDDYHNGRSGGRVHRATDILGPMGAPVYAAVSGVVTWKPGRHSTAGYALQVRGDDGRTYAYYHLGPNSGSASQAYAPGIGEGTRVSRGQQIGYLGDSGNAAGTPHLHFEIHGAVSDPYGSDRINPYPSLRAAERRGDFGGGGTTGTVSRSGGSSGGSSSSSGVLRQGSRGDAVRAWQQTLVDAGHRIGVDGVFGPQTAAATRAFQQSKGITVDGVVGPQTRAAAGGGGGGGSTAAPLASGLLRQGSRGDAVRAWQQALVGAGHRIAVDGVFGPQTAAATRAFQQSKGITVDGVVGPQTRGALG